MRRMAALGAMIAVIGCASPTPDAPSVIVTIPRGATFDAAVDSLVAHGVVTHPTTFNWYARLHGLPGNLKSGIYGFRADERWSELVDALKRGRGALKRRVVRCGEAPVLVRVRIATEAHIALNDFQFPGDLIPIGRVRLDPPVLLPLV